MQPLIPPQTLALFRGMTESMMDSTASVLPATDMWIDTGGGSGFAMRSEEATEFACRITVLKTQDELRAIPIAGKLDVSGIVLMTYPITETALGGLAQLTVDGVPYEVVGLPPLGTYSQHRQAYIRKVVKPATWEES